MKQRPAEYITSGRFIHDALVARVLDALKTLPSSMHATGRIEPFVLLWPKNEADGEHYDIVLLELSEGFTLNTLRAAATRVDAYGLCIVKPTQSGAQALLETPHGTRTWNYKREYRGGSNVLELEGTETDKDFLGIFWSLHH